MNSYQWVWEFDAAARARGDAARVQLHQLLNQGNEIDRERPDEEFALYERGQVLARDLGESWWVLMFEHWKIECLLFRKRDAQTALDLAARAVVEVRKPQYDAFPQRAALHLNLVSAYSKIDVIGYQTEIREAFELLQNEGGDLSDRVYLAQQWTNFLMGIDSPASVEAAWKHLALAEESRDGHYLSCAFSYLCSALVQYDESGAREHLRELSARGEEIARLSQRKSAAATLLMWRALAARYDGDESGAKRFYRLAFERQKSLHAPRTAVYFGAIEFHEFGGETQRALEVADAELREIEGLGWDFVEAEKRWKKCEIMHQAGWDFEAESEKLRAAAAHLKSKSHWDAKIASLKAL